MEWIAASPIKQVSRSDVAFIGFLFSFFVSFFVFSGGQRVVWRVTDSWLSRAIEGGGRGRIGVEGFEGAGRRSGLGVDGAPGTPRSGKCHWRSSGRCRCLKAMTPKSLTNSELKTFRVH